MKFVKEALVLVVPVLLFISANFTQINLIYSQIPISQLSLSSLEPIYGQILIVNEQYLIIETIQGVEKVKVSKTARVTKNSLVADLGSLGAHDTVVIIQNPTGEALSVDTLSKESVGLGKQLMLFSFGGVISINLLLGFRKKVRRLLL